MPTRPDDEYIYRFFDSDGELLYVGVTGDYHERVKAHKRKPWWPEVALQELLYVADHPRPRTLEQQIIRAERPRYNRSLHDAVSASWVRIREDHERNQAAGGCPRMRCPICIPKERRALRRL